MKNRNSGLGCGCSGGGDVDLGFVAPNSTQVVRYAVNPMTATLTTGRAAASNYTTVRSQASYYREGLAFGVAWTASLERNVTVPAQWHRDLEEVSVQWERQSGFGAVTPTQRQAFVSGFDMGIRVVLERRTSILSPIGRTYSAEFLLAQGTVAANTLFGQTRPAVLPAAGPRERYIALRNEAARTGSLVSLDRVSRSSVALPWLAYLSGDTNLVPSALDPYAVVSILKAVDQTLQRSRATREQTAWRSGNLSTSTPSAQEMYLEALYLVRN